MFLNYTLLNFLLNSHSAVVTFHLYTGCIRCDHQRAGHNTETNQGEGKQERGGSFILVTSAADD